MHISIQCCGSGSGSTWTRIYFAVLDPDPYWECGSGSGACKLNEIFTKKPGFLPFKKAFVPSYSRHRLFWTYSNAFIKYILRVKIQLFATQKSDQDPDRDPPGSASVWLPGSGSVSGSAHVQ